MLELLLYSTTPKICTPTTSLRSFKDHLIVEENLKNYPVFPMFSNVYTTNLIVMVERNLDHGYRSDDEAAGRYQWSGCLRIS